MKILPIQNFSTISPQQTRTNNNHTKFASNQLSSDVVVLQNKPKKKSISFGNLFGAYTSYLSKILLNRLSASAKLNL